MSTSEVFVAQISEVLLSRLVKLLNLLHGDGLFGWLRFIEYALTTHFSFQVSPYPTWVTWNLKRLRWDRVGGSSSVARSKNSISMILVQYCTHEQLELSMIRFLPRSTTMKLLNLSSCQVGDTCWATRLTVFPYWIWAIPQVPIAS